MDSKAQSRVRRGVAYCRQQAGIKQIESQRAGVLCNDDMGPRVSGDETVASKYPPSIPISPEVTLRNLRIDTIWQSHKHLEW